MTDSPAGALKVCGHGHDLTLPNATHLRSCDGQTRCRLCEVERKRRYRERAAERRKPQSAMVITYAGTLHTTVRAKQPEPLPVRCTPCHVCGAGNEGSELVVACRMCGSRLSRDRFAVEFWAGRY